MSEKILNEVLEELKKDEFNPELVQDNKLHFRVNKQLYRVRLPNQKENSDANLYKHQRYVKLISDDNTLTLKKLIKVLKEKQDVDIDMLDKKAQELSNDMMQLYLTLSKKKDSEKQSIKELSEQIIQIRDKRLEIVLEKAGYLAPAIEYQAQDESYRYLTSICTEKLEIKDGDEFWFAVWKNFEEYQLDNSKVPYFALGYLTELICGL